MSNKKICFMFENKNIKGIDCSEPQKGNPGIGGTEYCFILVSYYLNLYYKDKFDFYIFTNDISVINKDIRTIEISSIKDGLNKAKDLNIDYVILRTTDELKVHDEIKRLQIKTIMWSHNLWINESLDLMHNNENIVRHICVGKEQYDRILDHNIANKSMVIYNMFNSKWYDNCETNIKKEKIITYIGSIVPAKGFHVLAKQWKKVIRKHPDAKLKVIGNGKLYNRESKLGPYGIAEERYESKFIKYLLDKSGKIHESVEFLGNMGEEKFEVFKESKIGVVNPTARTETFCISAIEMGACMIPVVTIAKNGFLDTIKNKETGILVKNRKKIYKGINKLLEDEKYCEELGKNAKKFVNEKFNPEVISYEWIKMLESLEHNNNYTYKYKFLRSNFKWIRLFIKKTNNRFGKQVIPSLVSLEIKLYKKIQDIRSKI